MNREDFRKMFVIFVLLSMSSLLLLHAVKGQMNEQNPIAQPDIIVESIEFSDDKPMEDDNITITATVKNNGSIPLEGLTLVFLVDNMEISNISNVNVDPGQSKTYEINWKTKSGVHSVSAVLEYNGVMIQQSMNFQQLSVKPKPVGNVSSLLLSIAIIAVAVVLTNLFYSVIKAVRMSR